MHPTDKSFLDVLLSYTDPDSPTHDPGQAAQMIRDWQNRIKSDPDPNFNKLIDVISQIGIKS